MQETWFCEIEYSRKVRPSAYSFLDSNLSRSVTYLRVDHHMLKGKSESKGQRIVNAYIY